jgi:tripartite-type tricarboxylate transporter receptor subunit TctC
MGIARIALLMFTGAVMVLGAGVTYAQNYPYRPIRIVTSPVGGGNDFMARTIAQEISGPLGQQVIVENRAGGVVPGEIVARSAPDGYTLLAAGGTFTLGPLLQKTPYDVLKDFIPVIYAGMAPNIVVVHPALAAKTVKELIALAKAKPGQLNYSSAGAGSQAHLAAELFKSMAGVNVVRVAFGGNGPAITSAIAGEVQMMFPNPPTAMPHLKSGRLRALAVTSPQPSPLVPGLPTVSDSGLPGYEVLSMDFIFAPAKTPVAVINKLNREIATALHKPDVRQRYFNTGVEIVGSPPDMSAKSLAADVAKWAKVIKDGGIKAD